MLSDMVADELVEILMGVVFTSPGQAGPFCRVPVGPQSALRFPPAPFLSLLACMLFSDVSAVVFFLFAHHPAAACCSWCTPSHGILPRWWWTLRGTWTRCSELRCRRAVFFLHSCCVLVSPAPVHTQWVQYRAPLKDPIARCPFA